MKTKGLATPSQTKWRLQAEFAKNAPPPIPIIEPCRVPRGKRLSPAELAYLQRVAENKARIAEQKRKKAAEARAEISKAHRAANVEIIRRATDQEEKMWPD